MPHPSHKAKASPAEYGMALGQRGAADDNQAKPTAGPLARFMARSFLLAGIIAFFAVPVLAQGGTGLSTAPAARQNAHAEHWTFGAGWECYKGYQTGDGGACAKIIVPKGGYPSPSGDGWRCLRGYIRVDDICLEVVVPENKFVAGDASLILSPRKRT